MLPFVRRLSTHLFVAPIPRRQVRRTRTGKKTFTTSAHSKPAGWSSSILSHCKLSRELLTSQYLQRRVKKSSSPPSTFSFVVRISFRFVKKKEKPLFFSKYTLNKLFLLSRPFSRLARAAPVPLFAFGAPGLTNVADQRAGRESLGCVAERELSGLRAHWRTRHTRTA